MKNLMIAFTLSILTFSAVAAEKCTTCEPLNKIAQSNLRKKEEVKKMQDILVDFEFSKNKETRLKEIRAYLALSIKAVQADGTGISDEYIYNTYVLNREEFNQQIAKMKEIDRKTIEDSLKNISESRKTDDSQ